MVERSLADSSRLGLPSPQRLVLLWASLVSSLPQWTSSTSAMFVMDLVCRHALLHQDTREEVVAMFRDLHRKYLCDVASQGLINWITGINYSSLKLLFTSSLASFPWLAWFVVTAEERWCREEGLWNRVVQGLGRGGGVEEVLQESAKEVSASQHRGSRVSLVCRWVWRPPRPPSSPSTGGWPRPSTPRPPTPPCPSSGRYHPGPRRRRCTGDPGLPEAVPGAAPARPLGGGAQGRGHGLLPGLPGIRGSTSTKFL